MLYSDFQAIQFYDSISYYEHTRYMANSVDPVKLASKEASSSESILFKEFICFLYYFQNNWKRFQQS